MSFIVMSNLKYVQEIAIIIRKILSSEYHTKLNRTKNKLTSFNQINHIFIQSVPKTFIGFLGNTG